MTARDQAPQHPLNNERKNLGKAYNFLANIGGKQTNLLEITGE